jgi:hypothetical protein
MSGPLEATLYRRVRRERVRSMLAKANRDDVDDESHPHSDAVSF